MYKKYLDKVEINAKIQKILGYKEDSNGYLALKRYNLNNEVIKDQTFEEEGLLIILSGKGEIKIDELKYSLERKDVFTDKAEAVYIPIKTTFEINTNNYFEAILATTPCEIKKKVYCINKEDIESKIVGEREWEREVRIIQSPDSEGIKLIIGETINQPGKWSGFPPHKHDVINENESILKEAYFFKVNPNNKGFGLQLFYNKKDMDIIYKVKNNDLVFLPEGYHPTVATPGTELYYLWIIAGPKKELKVTIDDNFAYLS